MVASDSKREREREREIKMNYYQENKKIKNKS
jgi:hypothetical protein